MVSMEVYIGLLGLLLALHGVLAQMDNEFNITIKAVPMVITPVITKVISFKCAVPNTGNRRFARISNIGLITREQERYLAVIYYGEEAYIPDGSIFQGQEVKGNISKHDDITSTGYLNLTIQYPTITEINTNSDGTVCKVIGFEKLDDGSTAVAEQYVSVQVATVNATFQSLGGVFKVDPMNITYPLTDKLSLKCSIDGNNTFETLSSIAIKKDGIVVADTNNTNRLPNATIKSNLSGTVGYLEATVQYPTKVLAGSFECVIQVGNAEGTNLNVTSASVAVNHNNPSFADLVQFAHALDVENNAQEALIKQITNNDTTQDRKIQDLTDHDTTQDRKIQDLTNHDTTQDGKIQDLTNMINEPTSAKTYLKLAGGKHNSGSVILKYGDKTGPVCDDSWDIQDAHVVCRMLGYVGAKTAKQNNFFNYVFYDGEDFVMDEVACQGDENSLRLCPHTTGHDCGHSEVAGVVCEGNIVSGSVSLVGGTKNSGSVILKYGDKTGPVCDDSWDIRDADVVCRMLGYPSAKAPTDHNYFNYNDFHKGGFVMDDVACQGDEDSLLQCSHITNHNCGHGEVAGVECVDPGQLLHLEQGRVQCGDWKYWNDGSVAINDHYLDKSKVIRHQFRQPYAKPPKVFLSENHLHITENKLVYFFFDVQSVDTRGFTMVCASWSSAAFNGVKDIDINWISMPAA